MNQVKISSSAFVHLFLLFPLTIFLLIVLFSGQGLSLDYYCHCARFSKHLVSDHLSDELVHIPQFFVSK